MVDSTDHTDDTDRGLPTSEPAPSGSTRGGPPVGPAGPLRMLGFVLLIPYTVIALIALPFTVVVAMYTPLIIGGEGNPNHPAVAPVELMMLGTPLLILVGIIGGWIAWVRRRGRAALTYTLLPIVYGSLALAIMSALDAALEPPRPPPATAAVWVAEPPITLSRSGAEGLRPFQLRNTKYLSNWSASIRSGESSCRMDIHLHRLNEHGPPKSVGTVAFANLDPSQPTIRSAQAWITPITPGLYVVQPVEEAGCDWTLTLTPSRRP